ncbi:MAG: monooxygenase [Myxococcota bacterium]
MTRDRLVPSLALFALVCACGDSDSETPAEAATEGSTATDGETEATSAAEQEPTFTYWADAKAIIDARCGQCHRPDNIAPFALESYDQVAAVAAALPASLESGAMPPWPPADDCQPYAHSRALSDEELDVLLTWLGEGAPEGDPVDEPSAEPSDDAGQTSFEPNLTIGMAEPYTPVAEPDDYRCFLIPWPEDETRYVTGYRVVPGDRNIVHHVIAFKATGDTVAQVQALDDAEPGPGYTCFGGAGAPTSWVGSWVPGSDVNTMPPGTGVEVEPGAMMVVQMHYNTLSSAPSSDQTRIEFELAAEVDKPAVPLPFTNPQWVTGDDPMAIPAGEADVTYAVEASAQAPLLRLQLQSIGVGASDPFLVHQSALHMHYLGTSGRLSVVREGGDDECVLDIPAWDFGWQGAYQLMEPTRVEPDDLLRLSCTWDNSEANQPIVDGEVLSPQDVEWGEGTRDEMCLSVIYATGV